MYRAPILQLLLSLLAFAVSAEERPPLQCPHCGTWDENRSTPGGAAGERIVVNADTISIPICGQFAFVVEKQELLPEPRDQRTYRTSLTLKPLQTDLLCNANPDERLRLEVEISVGYHNDGGLGEFQVYRATENQPVLVATAWNYERDNPCDSGSGNGSAACMQIASARLYQTLSLEAYDAYALSRSRQIARFTQQFNPAWFADATMKFCERREAESGGGSWPYVHALHCQYRLFEAKLAEVRSWNVCQSKRNSVKCKFPSEAFNRSANAEP